jgi:branched-chain amino acid transport system permease protein
VALETLSRVLVTGFTIGCIYALIAVGLNLLWGTMRILNVSHGSLMMLGAYTAYWFFTLFNVSTFISAVIAMMGGAILGLILYKVLFSSELRKAKSLESLEVYSYLIFFGILIAIDNTAALLWTGDLRGYSYLTRSVLIAGTPLPLSRLSASIIAIMVCLGFYMFLQKSLLGKTIRAIIQDKDATQLIGVTPDKIYMICFSTAFAMAGLAGALISMFYSISPYMGLPYCLTAFVVVILGGLGNILGSLIGGLLLGLVITGGVAMLTPGYGFLIQYIIFILVIIFMPSGILGRQIR